MPLRGEGEGRLIERFDTVQSGRRETSDRDGNAGSNRRIGRNTLLLQMINPAPGERVEKSVSSPTEEVATVSADEHLDRISDNVATIAAL